MAAPLEDSRIAAVRRMGKHIVFDLESVARVPSHAKSRRSKPERSQSNAAPPRTSSPMPTDAEDIVPRVHKAQWIVHLGMTGRLQVCEPKDEVLKHTHAILKLASGRELRFVDPRRFGRLSVAQAANFDAGGFEPLEVEVERFMELFRGRKTPIKSALLNQKLLRGVGNIYADESLFRAGIRPRRRASSLTREDLRRLYPAVQEVLRAAIALGGSSVSPYPHANVEKGVFPLHHPVYPPQREPCLVCKTPVKRIVIAGRSSHYCPRCQK